FVLADQPFGARLFGTRDDDRLQYNVGWFRSLPKNASRQNQLGAGLPANDILLANLYVQDLGAPGFNSELVLILNHNRSPGTRIVPGASPGTPASVVAQARHDYRVTYLGYGVDGHLGVLNLTGMLYEVLGRESPGTFVQGATRVQGTFAALEAS